MTTPVFPCKADKRPWTAHGFKDASTDPATIDYWAWRFPGCLWGSPIPAGVFVLDVDVRHDGFASLEALTAAHGVLPTTKTTATRTGGRHYWLSTAVHVDQTAGRLGSGLDTRTHGRGYCIVPPSTGYSWVDDGPIAPAPTWLTNLLRPKPKRVTAPTTIRTDRLGAYARSALEAECRKVSAAPIGAGVRNHTLFVAACNLGELVGAGAIDGASAAHGLLAATTLPESEARSTILSGLNRGAASPRRVSA